MTKINQEQYTLWAQAALAQYPLKNPNLHFLGHSDNLTFRVEEGGDAVYLLRLHRPVVSYWEGMRQSAAAITSELAWLEALSQDGGFAVQHPIHTREGKLVASIQADDGNTVPATLFTWLEGSHFSPGAPEALCQVEQFGALVARMHEFSVYWTPPDGFSRPIYGTEHFHRVFARLLHGADLGVFSEEVYRTLRVTGQMIETEIRALPASPEYWGMIHADLHMGNFLIGAEPLVEGESCPIIPIDFSFCGLGHYLFDLSVCLAGGLNAALRPVFLRGYRSVRHLPESDMRAVDAYALAGIISYFACQIDNPAERKWLQRRIPEVVQKDCLRFMQGQRVLPEL